MNNNNIIKKGNNYFCAFCNAKLNEDTLMYSQEGEITYKLFLDGEGYVNFEQDEVYSDSCGEIYCRECGETLFVYDEELLKKILKK